MVVECVRRSWETYRKNTISFIIAELISLVITGMIALVGVWIVFNSIGISSLMDLYNLELLVRKIVSILPLLTELAISLVFFFIAGVVRAFMNAGLYGMAAESLRGRIKVDMMFQSTKNFGFKGIISSMIVGIIAFVLFMILVIGLNVFFPLTGGMIGFVIFFLIILTFSLVYPGIVVDGLSSTKAIQESFSVSKKNYFEILGLLLFYALMSLVALIPLIGIFIFCFVIAPMMRISLVFFYKRKK
ncbi:MAG: hypothetical protein QMD36_02295 [Candidatus Aenigmarchaeota archaeon]|nr:hypothetical protein [Candidatus Aenigmarchaeota archaeon]